MGHRIWSILWVLLCCINLQAQNWNLVWREDFGVAEDTVIKDFPNTSMTVPRHSFAAYESKAHYNNMGVIDYHEQGEFVGDCGYIDDGQYGIANNTRWAYKRFASCGLDDGGHFVAGKDHTGNKNGAMMIVNSEVGTGLPIYQQEIEFDLCDSREYKFVIYTSSVTTYNEEGGNANLELKVVNVKTGDIIKSIKTGEIPFWQFDGWGENNGGKGDVNVQREWTEYATEPFMVNNGDRLQLQVTNWGSGYNDFVIDDISLYRNDDVEIIDPTISSNTISSENKAIAGSCIFNASFNVPESVLASWQKVYEQVYFLWQRSKDDGLTWSNELNVSGINQLSAEFEVSAEETEVYRVIITGSASESEAKEQALYIAEHGGPKDGCSYYSISNTLAGVSPTPDCTYKEGLRTLWSDDFGVLSEESSRGDEAVKLTLKEGTEGLKNGQYAIISHPESALNIKNSWEQEKELQDASKRAGGAMLYTKLDKSTGDDDADLIYDKTLSGNLCPCKSMSFSFFAFDRNEWAGETLLARVVTEKGDLLGEATLELSHSNSRSWVQCSVPFTLPQNYKQNIHLQILNRTKQNKDVSIAFDNFSLYICGEEAPTGSIQIDKHPGVAYLGGEDCDNATNTLSILDDSEWKKSYPNYGFAWQKSTDHGKTWSFAGTDRSLIHQNSKGDLTEYRIVFAETEEAAEQAARNGLPNDPCLLFGYSNRLGIECKTEPCKAPQFKLSGDDSQTICGDRTMPITVKVIQTDDENVDKMQWFSKAAEEREWVAIEAATDSTLTIETFKEEVTDYLFIAYNDTCTSDSIFYHLNVHPKITLISNDTTVCEGSDLTLKAMVTEGSSTPTVYIWNNTNSTIGEALISHVSKDQTITLSANDGVCYADEVTFNVAVEPLYQPVWTVKEVTGCKDSTDGFLFIAQTADDGKAFYGSHTSAWVQNGETIGEEFSLDYTFTENTTLTHIVTGTYCPAVSYDFTIKVVKTPTLALHVNQEEICEGGEIQLNATTENATQLQWYFVPEQSNSPSQIIADQATESVTFQPQSSGSYHITVPDDGICGEVTSNEVFVKVAKALDFEFEELPTSICEGTDILLSATQTSGEATSFQWSREGTAISDQLSYTDQPVTSCTYLFEATSEICPPFRHNIDVKVDNPSTLTLFSTDDMVCEGSDIRLTTELGTTPKVNWQVSTNGNQFTTFSEVLADEMTYTAGKENRLYFRLEHESDGECAKGHSNIVEVEVEEPVSITVEEHQFKICEGGSAELQFEAEIGEYNQIVWREMNNELSSSEKNITVNPEETTTYTMTLLGKKCPSQTEEYTVEVEKKPTLALSSSATKVCAGEEVSFQLTLNHPIDFAWQITSEDGTREFTEGVEIEITAEKDAAIKAISKESGVCEGSASNEIMLTVEQPISIELAEENTICEGDEFEVKATITGTPNSITWYKRDANDDERVKTNYESSSFKVKPTLSTEYTIECSAGECGSNKAITLLIVEGSEKMTIRQSEDSICAGSAITLFTNYPIPERITWEKMVNGSYTMVENGTAEITIMPTETTQYRASAKSEAGCVATPANTTIHVFQPSHLSVEDKIICLGESTRMSVQGVENGAELMWFSSDDNFANPISEQQSVTLSPLFTTEYKIVAQNGQCVNEIGAFVTVTTPPIVLSCEEVTIGTYELEVESEIQPLVYDYGAGPTSSNRLENIAYGRKYDITISNASGCTTQYTLETPLYDIVIPEYFIPSQSNWVVDNLNRFPNATVKIYDRFGKMLIQMKSDTEGWDGTYNGHALPSTDYWYLINIPEIDRQFSGHFTLIREN